MNKNYGKTIAVMLLIAACLIVSVFMSGCKPAGNTAALKTGNGNIQSITSKLIAGSYPMLTVQKGFTVKWNLRADASTLNRCNATLVIPQFHIEKKLKPGDNIIEFTPEDTGTIPYSCKMGMMHGSIAVVDGPDNS